MATHSKRIFQRAVVAAALVTGLWGRPATAQLQWASTDGKTSFKLGLLAQGQLEAIDNAAATHSSNNLFFRRLRLLGSFKLNDKLSIFVDTDNPNLGKGNADGSKNNIDVYIQDFTVTYTFQKEFALDVGMMLTPNTYNHTQSAGSLMAIDYGAYSFNESTPLTARVGRDYGVQARGYLADHFEYRAGIFQGARGVDNVNPFRIAARVGYWAYGMQTGYFYRGTSLGKDKSLGIGLSYDHQKDFEATGGDLFFEQPISGGDGITIQGDYQTLNGKQFLVSLAKQTNILLEVGYYMHAIKLQPFVQYAKNDFDLASKADEKRTQFGFAYHIAGHNQTLKVGWADIDKQRAKKRNQFLMQYQVFQF